MFTISQVRFKIWDSGKFPVSVKEHFEFSHLLYFCPTAALGHKGGGLPPCHIYQKKEKEITKIAHIQMLEIH